MASLLVPIAYVLILVGSLIVFSYFYRRRLSANIRHEPWFPSHPERDIYITLLQQSDPPASEALLKAALIRRAVADVTRIFRIRDDKAALTVLLQKGSIGDELWNSFQAAEKELEAEIVEVVTEANTFVDGWGQFIFQSASEMVQNEKYRDIFLGIPKAKVEQDRRLGKTSKLPETHQIDTTPAPVTPSIAVPSTPSKPLNGLTNGVAKRAVKVESSASSTNVSPVKSTISLPSTDSAPLTPAKSNLELPTPLTTPSGKGASAKKKKNKK